MLFTGGAEVFARNLCILILAPYAALFMLGLGSVLLPEPPYGANSRLKLADLQLVRFFGGAGLAALLGFVLGMAQLLHVWITVPIFVGVLYLHLLRSPRPLDRFFAWLVPTEMPGRAAYLATLLFRALICLVVFLIVLEKAIFINLSLNDSLQLYFPYFAEVRRQHGIWLDEAYPIIFSYFVGRGHGVHLFFTSFTDPFFVQVLSVIYFVAIGAVVRRVVDMTIPADASSTAWLAIRAIVPDCALLLALSSRMLQLDSGKFHFETGAFLLFLSWATLLFLFVNAKQARWLGWALLPVVIALPIGVPQTQAMVAMILCIAAAASWRMAGPRFLWIYTYLIAAGFAAAALSLLLNQLYIGLAEVNPYQLFVKLIDTERFSRWSSAELLVYVSNSQGFEYIKAFSNVLGKFATAIAGLANAGEISVRQWKFSVSTTPLVILLLLVALVLISFGRHARVAGSTSDGIFHPETRTFAIVFFCMYAAGSLLTAISGHGSLQRLMSYLDVIPAVFLAFAIVLFVTACRQLATGVPDAAGRNRSHWSAWLQIALRKARPRLAVALIFAFCAACIIFSAFNLRTQEMGLDERMQNLKGAVSYFAGRKSLLAAGFDVPRNHSNARRFEFCLTLSKTIPAGEKVLPLNAVFTVVPACSGSLLLQAGQVQDTLHYVFAREFKQVVLGDPAHSYAILRGYGVNYFLVEKVSPYFWGPGVSDNFNSESLLAHFDVFHEDDDLYIFTWRGRGSRAVSPTIAEHVRKLHDIGRRQAPQYYHGLEYLRTWNP